jgi:hypothetical protein
VGSGGATGSGGAVGTSGTGGSGGAVGSGGTVGTGGVSGSSGTGGVSGSSGTGGVSGSSGTGGVSGSGGTGGSSGTCGRAVSACTSPQVRITDVNLGMTVLRNNEGDTQPIPMALAAMPGGRSRLAWLSSHTNYASSTTNRVHIAELDCNDQLVGTPFSFEAYDFADIAADADGGVVLVTRDAQGAGAQHCGDVNNLCGIPSDRPGCYDMYLVRFDNTGREVWSTKLTTASATNEPYTANSAANHFIWWYQHKGRIAHDGTNYAAYFCDAITIRNGSCVDIHEGDRMKVVAPGGALLSGHDSFDGGCSHSWNVRMVWDPRSSHFVMFCATDNPRAGEHRIARPAPYRTIWPSPGPDGSLSLGDVVLDKAGGYWLTASAGGNLHLLHSTGGLYDQDIALGSANFSHLVAYGPNHMIAMWESGSSIAAEVRNSGTGALVGSRFTINVPDHRYQFFTAYPDGSAAYPAQGANTQSVRIARVMPCSG